MMIWLLSTRIWTVTRSHLLTPIQRVVRLPQFTRQASYSRPGRQAPTIRPLKPRMRQQKIYDYLKDRSREIAIIGGVTIFYITHLETVPGSRRRCFNCISPSLEIFLSSFALEHVLETYKDQFLPDTSDEAKLVQTVLERLIPHIGAHDQGQWEVRVIDHPAANAFVVPGNKVFILKGILKITQDEDGLAAVLGHEIAHNVAHHAGERLSKVVWSLPFFFALSSVLPDSALPAAIVQLFIRGGSRKQEMEADYLGLLILARSCFDPEGAIRLWQRMQLYEQALTQSGQGRQTPEFLSTHPSTYDRIQKFKQWLPEAMAQRETSECGQTSAFNDAFQDAMKRQVHDEVYLE